MSLQRRERALEEREGLKLKEKSLQARKSPFEEN